MTAKFPYSKLYVGTQITIAISGPHIQVLDTVTGNLKHSTAALDDPNLAAVLKSGPIKSSALCKSEQYLVTSGEDKVLKVWQVDGLDLLSHRELPKRPTVLQFTEDAKTIITADKFGDVFSYPFSPEPASTSAAKKQKNNVFGQDNPAGGRLILGHTSLLTSFALTPDEKFIITADRDEHIRVSHHPRGYNIEMYCMGHEHFVSAVHIPSAAPSLLVSGGGDPILKVWDWKTGIVQHEIEIFSHAQSTILARPPKRKTTPDHSSKLNKRRRKKKAKTDEAPIATQEPSEESVQVPETSADVEVPEASEDNPVFCVQSIASIGDQIIFNIVGSTALFVAAYADPSSSIQILSFEKPVLDFAILDDSSLYGTRDVNFPVPIPSSSVDAVKKVSVVDGKLQLSETNTPLTESLSSYLLLPASDKELEALDLYGSLVSMPKTLEDWAEKEGNEELADPNDPRDTVRKGTKKAARRKTEQAIQDAQQSNPAQSEPDPKRHKSESEVLDTQ